jgi:hypothetical protein
VAIGQVLTGGLGNGTLTTTIPLVLLRGLTSAVTLPPDTPGIEAVQAGTLIHARQAGTLIHATQPNTRLHLVDDGGEF